MCDTSPRHTTSSWSVGIRTDLSAPEGHRQHVALTVQEGGGENVILLDPSSVTLITSLMNDLAVIILDSERDRERDDTRPLFE